MIESECGRWITPQTYSYFEVIVNVSWVGGKEWGWRAKKGRGLF